MGKDKGKATIHLKYLYSFIFIHHRTCCPNNKMSIKMSFCPVLMFENMLNNNNMRASLHSLRELINPYAAAWWLLRPIQNDAKKQNKNN